MILEKVKPTLIKHLFLVMTCVFIYSCHHGGDDGGGCHYTHQITGQSFKLLNNTEDENDSQQQHFESEYCKDTLEPYWNTALESLKQNNINVEQINLQDEAGGDHDYYKISGDPTTKQKYEEILKTLTGKMISSPRTKAGKDFCSKNLTPREDCPDCVNDLIYVGLVESITTPCKHGSCAMCDGNGCTLSFFSCKLGKVYIVNSKGRIGGYHERTLESVLKCKDFTIQGETLVFNQPVFSCLDTSKQDIFEVLKELCTANTVPELYTTRPVQRPENEWVEDEEGNRVEETEQVLTEVWKSTKLTLKYPDYPEQQVSKEQNYLRETVDDILSLPTGFECSFE